MGAARPSGIPSPTPRAARRTVTPGTWRPTTTTAGPRTSGCWPSSGRTRIASPLPGHASSLAAAERGTRAAWTSTINSWTRSPNAGFEQVNLDLIYGTPGETDDDWRASLEAVIGAYPDHVSAYSLIVEEGTRLAARI